MTKFSLIFIVFIYSIFLFGASEKKEKPIIFAGSTYPLVETERTPEEGLPFIRMAAELTVEAMNLLEASLEPGMKESDMKALIENHFISNGFGLSFPVISVSGKNTANIHGVPGERVIEENDIVMVDIGARYEGPEGKWCSDMTRTFFVGTPTEKQKEIYNIVLNAQRAALEKVKAGVKTSVVAAAARAYVKKHGYSIPHSVGHGVGNYIHVRPSISAWSSDVLKVGDAITIEPGIYLRNNFGVRIEDFVIVREDGYEALTPIIEESIFH